MFFLMQIPIVSVFDAHKGLCKWFSFSILHIYTSFFSSGFDLLRKRRC